MVGIVQINLTMGHQIQKIPVSLKASESDRASDRGRVREQSKQCGVSERGNGSRLLVNEPADELVDQDLRTNYKLLWSTVNSQRKTSF